MCRWCVILADKKTIPSQSVMELSLSAVSAKRCSTETAEAATASLGSLKMSLVGWGMSTSYCLTL